MFDSCLSYFKYDNSTNISSVRNGYASIPNATNCKSLSASYGNLVLSAALFNGTGGYGDVRIRIHFLARKGNMK